MSKTKVALTKGENHYQNVASVLELLKDELIQKAATARICVIKPNFVSTTNQLAATHVEAVRAILDFLKPIYREKILIAESAAFGKTFTGFTNFGYLDLPKKYNIELIDLASDKFLPGEIFDIYGRKIKIGIAKKVQDADFRISITPAKTHDEVIVTLGVKNMVMGSLDNRPLVHQGPRITNLNLAALAKIIPPHFSIIDGTVGMEGNGPSEGTPINSSFAVASLNPVSADTVATKIMGFNPEDIGYLYFLGIPKNIEIIGEKLEKCIIPFTPHRSLTRQLSWKKKPGLKEKFFIPILTSAYLRAQKMPFYQTAWFGKIKEPIKKILGY